jgi:hypothetical protein
VNQINTAWDEDPAGASAEAKPECWSWWGRLGRRLLHAAADQRTSADERETLSKLAKHPCKAIRAWRRCRCEHADLRAGQDAAALVPGGVQSQYANPLQRKLRDRLKKLGEAQPIR